MTAPKIHLVRRRSRRFGRREEPDWKDGLLEGDGPFGDDALLGAGRLVPVDGGGSAGDAVGSMCCELIGPDSSEVERHQLQVTVELDARIEIVDPEAKEGVLSAIEAGLGIEQLRGKGGGIRGGALAGGCNRCARRRPARR